MCVHAYMGLSVCLRVSSGGVCVCLIRGCLCVYFSRGCVCDEGMCVCLSLGFLRVCESHQGVCVCVCVRRIIQGMHYLYIVLASSDLPHQYLKSNNVLVGPDNEPMLVDYRVSHMVNPSTIAQTLFA